MPFLELNDYRPFYEIDDYTDPWTEPETILFIHGFTETTEAYRAWVPHVSRRYRMVRFDLRGFGKSGPVPADFIYSLEMFVDDMVRIINHVAKGPVHVVSAKSGGILGVKLAAMRPDLVKTLALICAPADAPKGEGWIDHMNTHGMRSWARTTMRPRLGQKMPERGIDWWVDMMGGTALSTAHAYLAWVGKSDISGDLKDVKCPTLVLVSDIPHRVSQSGDFFKKGIANSEFKVLPVDGYHASGTNPDLCADVTLEFIDRHKNGA